MGGWDLQPVEHQCVLWSFLNPVNERKKVSLSALDARRGSSSQISIPGTLVEMDLYLPPVSVPGFGSNVSSWLGPPFIHKNRQRLAPLASSAANMRSKP